MTITATLTQNVRFAENNLSVALDAYNAQHAAYAQAVNAQDHKAARQAWENALAAEQGLNEAREAHYYAEIELDARCSFLHGKLSLLTGQEQHRLLCRAPHTLATTLWQGEYSLQYALDETYGERLAEYGCATRHRTALQAFLEVTPLHTCATAPFGWSFDAAAGAWAEETDDVPF